MSVVTILIIMLGISLVILILASFYIDHLMQCYKDVTDKCVNQQKEMQSLRTEKEWLKK